MKSVLAILITLTFINSNSLFAKERIVSDTTQVTDNNVLYKVSSDAVYLYLNVSTLDKGTAMSMLRRGITVYFDVRGKHKKDVYIKYPYSTEPIPFKQGLQEESDNEEPPSFDLNNSIENIPEEAEYGFFDDKQQFHKELNNLDMKLGYKYTPSNRLLEFYLRIPKDKIMSNKTKDLSKLSIGVVTNKVERSFDKEKFERENQRGMERGRMSPSDDQESNLRFQHTSIDFWFDANLGKH